MFSAAVRSPSRLGILKHDAEAPPHLRSAWRADRARRSGSVPLVGRSRVVSILMVVVFPAPFGPEEREDLALLHVKGNIVHSHVVAELFSQVRHMDHAITILNGLVILVKR